MSKIIKGPTPKKVGRNTFVHTYKKGQPKKDVYICEQAAEEMAAIIAVNMIKLETFTGRPIKNISISFDNSSQDILDRLPAEICVELYSE
jgi:hypothetical protein